MAKKKLNSRTAVGYFKRLCPYLRQLRPQLLLIILGMGLYAGGYAARLLVIRPFT